MMITVFSVPGIAENNAQEVTAEIPMGGTDVRLPAVEGTEDLLKNGNLEEIDASGKPVGWSSRAYDGENSWQVRLLLQIHLYHRALKQNPVRFISSEPWFVRMWKAVL